MAALLFLVLVLIWGSTWYGIHLQANGTPAAAAVAVRFAIAAALLLVGAALAIGRAR